MQQLLHIEFKDGAYVELSNKELGDESLTLLGHLHAIQKEWLSNGKFYSAKDCFFVLESLRGAWIVEKPLV